MDEDEQDGDLDGGALRARPSPEVLTGPPPWQPRRAVRVVPWIAGAAAVVAGIVLAVAGNRDGVDLSASSPVYAAVYLCGGDCPEATDADVRAIGALLRSTDGAFGVTYLDHQRSYDRFRTLFASEPGLADAIGPSDLPESFTFAVPSAEYPSLERRLLGMHGVASVQRALGTPAVPAPPSPS